VYELGLIARVAVIPANVLDGKALKHIGPKEASLTMKQNGCVSKAIVKNNMGEKDFERDRRIAKQTNIL